MIDIHCHILPGIDDGAKDIATSIEMLRTAEMDGIEKIIATPHYRTSYFENNFDAVKMEVGKLNEVIKNQKINVEILPGQEIFLDTHTVELYKSGKIKGLNATRYMLFELPFDELPHYTFDVLYELRILGIVPILAHPERYEYIIKSPGKINEFIEEKCLFQINSHSINGVFGRAVKKTSELLLKNRICDFIASDAHTVGNRCPEIKKALDKIQQFDEELRENVQGNVTKLINDELIQQNAGKVKGKKSIFNF